MIMRYNRPLSQGCVLSLHLLTALVLGPGDSSSSAQSPFPVVPHTAVEVVASRVSLPMTRHLANTSTVAARSTAGLGYRQPSSTNSSSLDMEEDFDPLTFASAVSEWCGLLVRNSTLYQEQCFQRKPQILRRLLVTGAGGCGTHYAVDLFRESGYVTALLFRVI